MNLKTPLTLSALLLAFAFAPILAQTPNEADVTWLGITTQLEMLAPKREPISAGNLRATASAPKYADYERTVAIAREFQAKYPGDPRCKEARKIELASLLKQQRASGAKLQPADDAGIDNYIKDPAIPAADRYDISALAKDVRAGYGKIKSIDEARALRASHALELTQEFPEDPRGHGYLLAVAKSLPAAQAIEIANNLLESTAPAKIKEGAARLLAQKNMEGKKLQIAGLDLDACKGQPVIIYTWTIQRLDIFEFVKRRCTVTGVKLIGINIDPDADAARQMARKIRPPGDQYYDSGGMDGPIVSQLNIQMLVSVYIVDAEGRLADTCGHENTTEKLKALHNASQGTNKDAPATKGGAL